MYKVVHLASYVLQFELLMAICLSQLILFSSKARKTFKLRESDASKRKLTLMGFIFFPAKGFKYQDVKAIEHIWLINDYHKYSKYDVIVSDKKSKTKTGNERFQQRERQK